MLFCCFILFDNDTRKDDIPTICIDLTRAVLVACVFRVVLGGGGVFTPPPSNSAPRPRSDTR